MRNIIVILILTVRIKATSRRMSAEIDRVRLVGLDAEIPHTNASEIRNFAV